MLTDTLNAKDARGMICAAADRIIWNKPLLTEIDSRIGDGDHGIGMAGGMQKARAKLDAMPEVDDVYTLFYAAGKAMLMSMGGASGVIFGSLFLAGAKGMEPKSEIGAEELYTLMRRGLEEIQARGGAQVGDKTMVDALAPAVEAMAASYGEGIPAMLKNAEEAAAAGVENTKGYAAKFGRAKSLMERAIGYQDAGATSVWLILGAMREYAEQA